MSGLRTRGITGRKKKVTKAKLAETVRRQQEARAFYERQKSKQAGLPAGSSIASQMTRKCDDNELNAQERFLKIQSIIKVT